MPGRVVARLDLGTQESDVDEPLTGGPSGSAHLSVSCAVVLIMIAADLESQLEIVSEVPRESIRFSPDGRLPHIPSLVRTAVWDERCSGIEESCELSPPGSAEEEHAGSRLPVAKARSAKRQRNVRRQAGSRPLLRSVSAKPNSRQQWSLTWRNLMAGWPPSK